VRFVGVHGKHIIFSFGGRGFLLFLVLSLFYEFYHVISIVCFFVEGHFFLKNFTKEKGKRKLKHGDKLL